MDELLQQFLLEATELVQQASDDLLALEREPANRSHIERLFRAVHTLKGSAGLFAFAPLQKVLFAAEDVLTSANRSGELDSANVDPLIAIIEWTERCMNAIEALGALPGDADARSDALTKALSRSAVDESPSVETSVMPDWASRLFERNPKGTVAIRYVPRGDCFFSGDDPIALMSTLPLLLDARVTTASPWPELGKLDPFQSNLIFEAVSGAPRSEVDPLFRLIPDQATLISRQAPLATILPSSIGEEARRTIRVDVGRVDAMVDSIGELFVAKNAMSNLVVEARQIDGGLALARRIAAVQMELDRLALQLQRTSTSLRLVPLNETFRRLPRVVREVSAQLSKPTDLEVEGGSIEADKSVVDALFEPLLHILRNAIDHGIESTDVRGSFGKPPRGRVAIRARQVGYRIEIAVSDDGAGVDLERVRALAIERGIFSPNEAAIATDTDLLDVVFSSGFSTASAVTDVSGRGVGMDVVRREVEKLGGRAWLESTRGEGSTVKLSLPTSSALTRIMIVDAAGDHYAVPMDVVSETLRLSSNAINRIRAGEAFTLRDRTVPIVRLAGLVGQSVEAREVELLVVTDVRGKPVGLVVDSIGERLETILRPVSGLLKAVNGISGTTVLGDGTVVLVLDLEALLE